MNDSPDLAAVTQVQQQIWSKGDFAMVAGIVYNASEDLAEALELVPDERVLDVACGSGNGAIAAARRTWGGTVGADYVPALLERGRERAAAERLEVEFVEADAQDLPFEDAQLRRRDVDLRRDVRPRPAEDRGRAAARGQARRPDRDGATGPPAAPSARCSRRSPSTRRRRPGVDSPLLWGTEERLRELFGDGISDLRVERRISRQPFRSADHYIEFFRTYFGPTQMAYERVGAEGEQALTDDLQAFLEAANTAGDRALVLEAEYLRVIATRA